MVLYGFIWFYMVLYGFIWFYMVLYGMTGMITGPCSFDRLTHDLHI